jgi:hypothetical protein
MPTHRIGINSPATTGDYVLRDLGAVLGAEFADPLVVGVHLGHDGRAVGVAVLAPTIARRSPTMPQQPRATPTQA